MSLNTDERLKHSSSTGIGTFRALAAFTGVGTGATAFQNLEACDSCVSGTQIRISAQDVLKGLTKEAHAVAAALEERERRNTRIHVQDLDPEASTPLTSNSTIAIGGASNSFEHPRCNCHGDHNIAKRWQKQASTDLGKFLENMFGVRPEDMTRGQRVTMRSNCAPYIPAEKLAMLNNASGRLTPSFWDEFSGKLQNVKPGKSGIYTDADALEILKSRFPRYKGVQSVTAIKLTPTESLRLRNSPDFTRHLSDKILEQLGIVTGTRRRAAALTPEMTLAEAEAFLLRTMHSTLARDPQSGKLQATGTSKSRTWRYIATRYRDKLPQVFLNEYGAELLGKTKGRPKKTVVTETKAVPKIHKAPGKVIVPKSRGEQQKERLKRRDAKLRKEGIEPKLRKKIFKPKPDEEDLTNTLFDTDTEQQAQKQVPSGLIKDPDRLRRYINNMSQQIDDKFLFGTPFEKYTGLQWALMDSIRDSIAPELFNRFRAQVEGVRAQRNRATGGAYSSIIGNPQLALAHITTAWYCGEIV